MSPTRSQASYSIDYILARLHPKPLGLRGGTRRCPRADSMRPVLSILTVISLLLFGCSARHTVSSNVGVVVSGGGTASITAIKVIPANRTILPGETIQFHALDQSGKDITSQVTWRSSDPKKATITSSGLSTGRARGTVTITAAARR